MFLTYWSCSLYPIRFIKAYYSLYKNRARLFLLPALVWLNWFEWNKKGSWWPKDKGLVPYLYKVPCFLCIASYFSVTRDPPDNSLSWEIFVTTFPRQLIEEGFCERSSDYDIKLTTVVQNLYIQIMQGWDLANITYTKNECLWVQWCELNGTFHLSMNEHICTIARLKNI